MRAFFAYIVVVRYMHECTIEYLDVTEKNWKTKWPHCLVYSKLVC